MPGGCSPPNLLAAARQTRRWCDTRKQEIVCLQPFMHFGGLLDRSKAERDLETVELWADLASTLGTNLILLPSSFLPAAQLADDMSVLVCDLQNAADIGLRKSPTLRFAFEALCWGTRVDAWQDSWKIVSAVHRPQLWPLPRHIQHGRARLCRSRRPGRVPARCRLHSSRLDAASHGAGRHGQGLSRAGGQRRAAGEAAGRGAPALRRGAAAEDELVAQLSPILRRRPPGRVPARQEDPADCGARAGLSRLAELRGLSPQLFAARASQSWARLVRDLSLEPARPLTRVWAEKGACCAVGCHQRDYDKCIWLCE
ncbi:hypothetical protein G3M48_007772 [Beauveria asiatica]|uniref:Uncharacterized protein n=1 Tax=Beauveria asiatica TaxID=1069075 RepID=A0AAW0S471_9HYPO